MTDKEKQIEEMARVMCPTAEYTNCDKCVAKKCTPQMYAKILYDAGYRKTDREGNNG